MSHGERAEELGNGNSDQLLPAIWYVSASWIEPGDSMAILGNLELLLFDRMAFLLDLWYDTPQFGIS